MARCSKVGGCKDEVLAMGTRALTDRPLRKAGSLLDGSQGGADGSMDRWMETQAVHVSSCRSNHCHVSRTLGAGGSKTRYSRLL